MASRLKEWAHHVSPYLLVLVLIATLGPLQFGLHMVSRG